MATRAEKARARAQYRAMAKRAARPKRKAATPAQKAAARANLAKARAARKARTHAAYGLSRSYRSRVSTNPTKSGRLSFAAHRRLTRPHPKSELARVFALGRLHPNREKA